MLLLLPPSITHLLTSSMLYSVTLCRSHLLLRYISCCHNHVITIISRFDYHHDHIRPIKSKLSVIVTISHLIMSSCSCNEDPKKGFWEKLATKYEKRVKELARKRCEITHRLEVMQLQMPAYLCYNLKKDPKYAEKYIANFIKLFQAPSDKDPGAVTNVCTCNPCPVKVPDNFPKNLYDFKYPQPISRFPRSSRKKKDINSKKDTTCDCTRCAELVIERLQKDGLIFDDMVPEKLTPNNDMKKTKTAGECTCTDKEKAFRDATVCECDLCAQEVLKRINAVDLNFEPLTCGCSESQQPNETDIEVPICKCDSCRLQLEKKLGVVSETRVKEECICYDRLGVKFDGICDCEICGEKFKTTESCECKIGDATILPICACSECQKPTTTQFVDFSGTCICNCDICKEQQQAVGKMLPSSKNIKESSFEIPCICNCEECNVWRRKQEAEDRCDCEADKKYAPDKSSVRSCDCCNEISSSSAQESEVELSSTTTCPCADITADIICKVITEDDDSCTCADESWTEDSRCYCGVSEEDNTDSKSSCVSSQTSSATKSKPSDAENKSSKSTADVQSGNNSSDSNCVCFDKISTKDQSKSDQDNCTCSKKTPSESKTSNSGSKTASQQSCVCSGGDTTTSTKSSTNTSYTCSSASTPEIEK